MKKRIVTVLAIMLALLQVLPYNSVVTAKTVAKVKSVKVTNVAKKKLILKVGDKFKLKTKVTVSPNKKANKKLKYSSSNKKVATVSSQGVITEKKKGKATITVMSKVMKKKKVKIALTVEEAVVKKITLDETDLTLEVDEEYELECEFTPSSFDLEDVTWSSSDEDVAEVDDDGVIYANEEGTAVITVEADEGGAKATCKVTVIENSDSEDDEEYDEEDEEYDEEEEE